MDTITCLWIQKKLDTTSILCINSWLKLNYKVRIYTYTIGFRNEWINTEYDKQVEICDANSIYDNGHLSVMKYEFISDKFRFILFRDNKIKKEKVIWLDTDQFLIRRMNTTMNFVAGQHTLLKGAFAHKKGVVAIPTIFAMCFNGTESVDWIKILREGKSSTAYQSGYLKRFEKEISNTQLMVDPVLFAPIHWGWAKDIYTKPELEKRMKYGLKPPEYCTLTNDKNIIGIHLWRQMVKKNKWKITHNSIYNKLKNKVM